jgi:molecular chaperone GrpE
MGKKDKNQKLQEELEEIQAKYIRSLAEIENTRKRMQKEKTESISFAIENTICEFLPLIDNFENALNFAKNSSEEVKNWAVGFQMILSQLKDILHNHGIVAFHSDGNQFDPYYHEAVEIVETDEHLPGSIIQEFAKGYKSANRVIRPAKVKVTKQTSLKENNQSKDENLSEDCNCNDVVESEQTQIGNENNDDDIESLNKSFDEEKVTLDENKKN